MSVSRHTAVVGVVTNMTGHTCGKPYQKIRVAVQCDGDDPDEIVTLLTDYDSNYRTHDVITVERIRNEHITAYKIVRTP